MQEENDADMKGNMYNEGLPFCYNKKITLVLIPNKHIGLDLGTMMNTPYQTSISPFVSDSSTTPLYGAGGMFTPAAFTPFGGDSSPAGYMSPGYMSPGYVSPFYAGKYLVVLGNLAYFFCHT